MFNIQRNIKCYNGLWLIFHVVFSSAYSFPLPFRVLICFQASLSPSCQGRCQAVACRICIHVDHPRGWVWAHDPSTPTTLVLRGGRPEHFNISSWTWKNKAEFKISMSTLFNVYVHRPDHVMGPEGGIAPPGNQNNMVPSNSDPSMFSGNRYASHQRYKVITVD